MNIRRIIIACGIIFANSANAGLLEWARDKLGAPPIDYGAWYCSGCHIINPDQDYNSQSLGQVAEYIRINNAEIHQSEAPGRWIANSTITICDGANCLKFYFDPLPAARFAPRSAGFPQTVLPKQPKVPKNPDPQTSAPVPPVAQVSVSGGGDMAWNPFATVIVTLPPFTDISSLPKTPSVTVIQNPTQIDIIVDEVNMAPPQLDFIIGISLNWGIGSIGLDPPGPCSSSDGGWCYAF